MLGRGCQAEQVRAELDIRNAAKADAMMIGVPELQLKHTANIRAEQKDVQRLGIEDESKRRLETTRGLEKRVWAENLEEESLELCKTWREFRKMKSALSEEEMWHELNVKEGWKIRAEGRKLKSEATMNKKKRFGKVCRKGLTD